VTPRATALRAVAERLRRAGVATAEHDAEALLLHALGIPRAALWSEPAAPLSAAAAAALESLAAARGRRVPLQILLGEVPFHGVTIETSPGVFVPRPETEVLVDAALAALRGAPAGSLLDLGAGTGAVAVALLAALPDWRGTAVDRSRAALELAARNAARNGLAARLRLAGGDFGDPAFTPPGAPFDALVANPPYVRSGDIPGLEPEVRDHDPPEALDGGPDGLDALRWMASRLAGWVRPGGLLALEIGADQADDAVGLFRPRAPDVRVLPDLAGRPRVLLGRLESRDA
jgi:release factor glutamine methyltransferase